MGTGNFTDADRRQLEQRGVTLDEAGRQLALFERPARYVKLVRPCMIGDGITRLAADELDSLATLHADAAREGRFRKFVPASGAASRMFRELLAWQADPAGADSSAVETLAGRVHEFAFRAELERVLAARGLELRTVVERAEYGPLVDALLGATGLGYAALPKALLHFHTVEDSGRTPFEEHLMEAVSYVRDAQGLCRLHFTVSPEHRAGFRRLFERVGDRYAAQLEARFEIGYSEQKPSTDTLAVDAKNRPVRDSTGQLVFRPAGHGALIENLNDLQGDLVFVKNIDNVQPEQRRGPTVEWKRYLAGSLVRLREKMFECVTRLGQVEPCEGSMGSSLQLIRDELGIDPDGVGAPDTAQAKRAYLIDRLNRPLRACGVVPNTGEPGGGPFWVAEQDGTISRQIVEGAQVDPDDPEQQEIFRSSTHFNPVDLVCSVRDVAGRPFDLNRFVDPDAVIITSKSIAGADVRALERPGLWNGAMAGWNTQFVEVPLETFSPVKSVFDLLRDEHR